MRFIITLIISLLAACTAPNKATRALESQGFSNVEITGYSFFACSEDDFSSTGFRATNPNGELVSGTVCCGMLTKSCTVRW